MDQRLEAVKSSGSPKSPNRPNPNVGSNTAPENVTEVTARNHQLSIRLKVSDS